MEQELQDFRPDWMNVWTAHTAEIELRRADFKFNGPGWYFHKGDTLLVIPIGREPTETFHQRAKDGELFKFYVWNCRDASPIFGMISQAPTRTDDRT